MNGSLNVNCISKKVGHFKLEDISFTLEPGYILGLVGPNGSGKTTLLNVLAGVTECNKGNVYIDDVNSAFDLREYKNSIAYISDKLHMLPKMSVMDNGIILGQYYELFEEELFKKYLREFDIEENSITGVLSKGEKVKLQLAFALSHHPRYIFMDEPTEGLDPVFRRDFLSLLRESTNNSNTSVVFSSHILSDLDKVADYVGIINEGKLIKYCDIEELKDNYLRDNGEQMSLEYVVEQVLNGKETLV